VDDFLSFTWGRKHFRKGKLGARCPRHGAPGRQRGKSGVAIASLLFEGGKKRRTREKMGDGRASATQPKEELK